MAKSFAFYALALRPYPADKEEKSSKLLTSEAHSRYDPSLLFRERFMYAIIETGGKQYRVQEGDVLDVELLEADSKITFSNVLLYHDGTAPNLGLPYVPNCIVQADVLGEVKGPKVIAYKFKPCKRYHRKVGHRQRYSRVKITGIKRDKHGT